MIGKLPKRILSMSESATFEMARRSGELAAKGIDVINLSMGEPDFDTPEHIKAAAKRAIDENYSHYSPVAGYASLKQAIAGKLQKDNGLAYNPDEILVSNGAKQSICNAVLALTGPGDEVIIPAPYWVSYPQMVRLAGATPIFIDAPISQGHKITPAQLEAAITPRTRLLILCSPCNPSGAVYSAKELEALADVIKAHDGLTVISDEIYEHINYTGRHASIAKAPGMKERTIIVNGVSKAYAMTGWRIGYIAAPKWIVDACNKLQGQYTSGPGSISQKAAEAALSGPQDEVARMREAFRRRRDLIVRLMREIPGIEVSEPEGAFYLLPKVSAYYKGDITNSTDLALYLLEHAHVATVAGEAFGAPDCIRLSYAISEDRIAEAVKRIKEALV